MAGERELLLDFARHLRMRPVPAEGEAPAHDSAEAERFREGQVDVFLTEYRLPGFAGYTGAELAGTARDERAEPEQGT